MLGLAAAVMLQAGVAAPITNPDWVRRPTGEDVLRVYPKAAEQSGLSGRATLRCIVTGDGTLTSCEIVNEDPTGQGFGQAALDLVPTFAMRHTTKDGVPVAGGVVRIPLRFVIQDDATDTTSLVTSCYGEASAKAERDPNDEEAISAYGYFASLLGAIASRDNVPPRAFEGRLVTARQAALRPAPDDGSRLERCLKLFRDTRPATAP